MYCVPLARCICTAVAIFAFSYSSSVGAESPALKPPTISAFADIGGLYTTNFALAETDEQHEISFSPEYGLRAEGTLATGLTYSLSTSINSSREDRFPTESGETLGFEAALEYKYSGWTFGLGYNPTMNYSQWFEDYFSTSHLMELGASRVIKLADGTTVKPSVSLARRDHTNAFADRNRALAKISLSRKVFSDRGVLSLTPSMAYDLYDRSPVPGDRRDVTFGVSLALMLQVNKEMTWGAVVAYQQRESSVTGLDYEVWNFIPKMIVNYEF